MSHCRKKDELMDFDGLLLHSEQTHVYNDNQFTVHGVQLVICKPKWWYKPYNSKTNTNTLELVTLLEQTGQHEGEQNKNEEEKRQPDKESMDRYRERMSQVEVQRHADHQSPLGNNYENVNNNITEESEYSVSYVVGYLWMSDNILCGCRQ